MKIKIKGHIWDLLAFRRLVPKRRRRMSRSSATPQGLDKMNLLARQLHPSRQALQIAAIREEAKTSRSFRLVIDPKDGTGKLAYFRAGQYLSFKTTVGGVRITRPYSISSAPSESLGESGFYEITIRRKPGGLLSDEIWTKWQVGTKLISSGPQGHFYHEPLRDEKKIVGLAGGSGITPFRSMAREISRGEMDAELLLLYGSSEQDDILFYDELAKLAESDNIRVVHVLSCDEVTLENCEQGFVSAETIARYADVENSSFFLCGPPEMHDYVRGELATLSVPRKRIRSELYGAAGTPAEQGHTSDDHDQVHQVRVRIAGGTTHLPAIARESLLVALERANLAPPSECRTGECGYCRAQVISGDLYLPPGHDRRRAADRDNGFVHLCTAYPLSDVDIIVPRAS